ncbi:MAG TPA: Stk1 family PASTA domain-containing Ser/Thr kinase [Streptosporangiaceae bacterium]|jgi:serine/threonine-protein kinase|nr:Stk1 family PASTA domain-containing Ser/Thr kinase [Streptosporangiaceae bacterium]
MDATLADPLVGRLLDGRYQVETQVAMGGMATVYRAMDTRLDRQVALKVMHADLARDEEFVNRFIGEAKSVARLSHPNVVSVYDQGRDGSYLYLAMEYLPGRTLRNLLDERGWFPPGEALGIMVPLLSGLAAAHRAGIVHRDVKPENVLIAPDGHLKVVDFGLARALTMTHQTRTGQIIGTVAYLAPEQVTGTGADARTDIYAAGIVLFELLTGTKPHTGDSPLSVAYKHVNESVPAPSRLAGGIPPAVDQLVLRATSRDPGGRPDDAADFLRAVQDTSRRLGGGWPGQSQGTVSVNDWAGYTAHEGGLPAGYGQGSPYGQHSTQVLMGGAPSADGHTIIANRDGWPGSPGGTHAAPGRGRGRRIGVWVALGVLLVAVAGAGGWWLTERADTKVPAVAGLTESVAVSQLRADGFSVHQATAVNDNSVKVGDVVRTVPAIGTKARKGSIVTLVPSAGPRLIKVPDVSGQQLSDAKGALRHAGLIVGQVRQVVSSSVDAGIVVSTSPAAGLRWPQPKPVTISVSEGPPLPNFVGQNVAAIQQWAGQNGIQLNVQQDTNSNQPQGTITKQSPGDGTPISQNETVTVFVSTGPPEVTIPPNLAGQNVNDARKQLQQLGFKVNVTKFGPFNKVISVNPSGQAPKGSTVTIYAGF